MELANISELLNYAKTQRCEFTGIFNPDPYCQMKAFTASLNSQTKGAIIGVIIAYIVVSFLASWFLSKSYKSFIEVFKNSEFKIIRQFCKKLKIRKNRIMYFYWIKDRLVTLLIGALLLCLIYFW